MHLLTQSLISAQRSASDGDGRSASILTTSCSAFVMTFTYLPSASTCTRWSSFFTFFASRWRRYMSRSLPKSIHHHYTPHPNPLQMGEGMFPSTVPPPSAYPDCDRTVSLCGKYRFRRWKAGRSEERRVGKECRS